MAIEADFLRRFHGSPPNHQPELERFMTKRMGAKIHRGESQPSLADLAR
jgi:hypothetical protein